MFNRELEQTQEKFISGLNALYKMSRIPPETCLFGSLSYRERLKINKYLRTMIDYSVQLGNTRWYEVVAFFDMNLIEKNDCRLK